MTVSRRWATARLTLWLLVLAVPIPACGAVSGSVRGTGGEPIPYTFVALLSDSFGTVGYAVTDESGAFSIDGNASKGYLVVQPPAEEDTAGYGIYRAQPRMYELGSNDRVDIRLPAVGCLVLQAYDSDGTLMRWEDFRKQGLFSEQFIYATNLEDQARPATCWPVYDKTARDLGSPREKGLPALACETGGVYAAQVLFWPVPGYGKLHLRADNAGAGFAIKNPGDAHVLELNVELARTAVANLERRVPAFGGLQDSKAKVAAAKEALESVLAEPDAKKRAAAADTVLASALRLRDELEVAAAKAAVPSARTGTVQLKVKDASGVPVAGCTVRAKQRSHDFLFGVFEGSPYNARAFKAAREAGFELATVLLGWNWTDAKGGKVDKAGIEHTFGISALGRLGYTVKAHGVVWLQQYGIMPDRALALSHQDLCSAALEQEDALLGAFGGSITIWEAMNEPAATNQVNMPRAMVHELLAGAAQQIKKRPGLTSLVNSPHEVYYGAQYTFFGTDNKPTTDYPVTYSEALEMASKTKALEHIDVIGLQFYPGFHFNETFGGLQGPAAPPSWLVDTLERYSAFGKPIHITEFSTPSSYESDWTSGYWREPWTETTQADYAEAAFLLAFGNPNVQSITWWDVSDVKPSVITGGLINPDGSPKPALERIQGLIREWTTETTVETNGQGVAELTGFAGQYDLEVQLPNGKTFSGEVHLDERAATTHVVRGP